MDYQETKRIPVQIQRKSTIRPQTQEQWKNEAQRRPGKKSNRSTNTI